jgi:exodeoxyribonuclease VII large subunit
MSSDCINVSEINNMIKLSLASTFDKLNIFGEISNIKITNGNAYFSLKDDNSQISAVIWKCAGYEKDLQNGNSVIVTGKITCFNKLGTYQIVVTKIEKKGKGVINEKYEKLKQSCEKSGLFSRKKCEPTCIKRLAILTSTGGAAIKDVMYVLNNNDFKGEIYIKNCYVQGQMCPMSVVSGIKYFDRIHKKYPIDVLLITRGGGSIEDLMGYSSLPVIKSIYSSKIYTISAIGHEIDFMLSDYTADYRAPTPSIGAEFITKINSQQYLQNTNNKKLIDNMINKELELINTQIKDIKKSKLFLETVNPKTIINSEFKHIDNIIITLQTHINTNLNNILNNIQLCKQLLKNIDIKQQVLTEIEILTNKK